MEPGEAVIHQANAIQSARLRRYWEEAWNTIGLTPPNGAYEDLTARYSESHRAYHTLQHLDECFAQYESIWALCQRPGAVSLALWLHDAIYDPRSTANEDASAELAAAMLATADAGADLSDRVRELILATRHTAAPTSPDAGVVVDIDLAILAADATRFEQYECQIRREYDWVAEDLYRQGRRRLLRDFAARPWIYHTSFFRERFEQRARRNIDLALARLSA